MLQILTKFAAQYVYEIKVTKNGSKISFQYGKVRFTIMPNMELVLSRCHSMK